MLLVILKASIEILGLFCIWYLLWGGFAHQPGPQNLLYFQKNHNHETKPEYMCYNSIVNKQPQSAIMSKTVSIRLEDNILVDLDKLSKITERSKAWLMGKAVEQYIKNESWQVESIEKTLQKVKSGNAKFANHESVTQWLESWGTDNELEPPICK